MIPLQYGHWPDTRIPSSTGRAFPRGAHTPAATASASPKISAAPSAGRYADRRLLVAAMDTHQPAEASPRAIVSAQRSVTAGAAFTAPSAAGTPAPLKPDNPQR